MHRTDRLFPSIRGALAILMTATLLLLLAGCSQSADNSFPPLETSGTGGTNPSQSTSETEGTELVESLTIALPMDAECAEAIRLLYLARQSGLIRQEPGQYIGLQVLPDDLRQFDNGMIVDLISVPAATGATTEQIDLWRSSGAMPDIIYSRAVAVAPGLNGSQDLTDYLYTSPLVSADNVYIPAIESCRTGEHLYSIPYLASTPVLFMNMNLLSQLQLTLPAVDWTWTDWLAFMAQAQQAIDDQGVGADQVTLDNLRKNDAALAEQLANAVFVTNDLSGLLEWLPISFDPAAGWAAWDGQSFLFDSDSFQSAADYLRDPLATGYSTGHLDQEQFLAAFAGADPVRSGRVLMWAGDSADLDVWRQAGLQVQACLMPGGFNPTDESAQIKRPVLPISVRTLVVKSDSQYPERAASFAAFLALDADAMLLQSRYQLYSGLVPMIDDIVVQENLIDGQADWGWLLQVTDRLPLASCSSQQVVPNWDQAVADSLGQYGTDLLRADNSRDQNAIIRQMISAAQAALQEE